MYHVTFIIQVNFLLQVINLFLWISKQGKEIISSVCYNEKEGEKVFKTSGADRYIYFCGPRFVRAFILNQPTLNWNKSTFLGQTLLSWVFKEIYLKKYFSSILLKFLPPFKRCHFVFSHLNFKPSLRTFPSTNNTVVRFVQTWKQF